MTLVKKWHSPLHKMIWYEELLSLPKADRDAWFPGEGQQAEDEFIKLAQTIVSNEPGLREINRLCHNDYWTRVEDRTRSDEALWDGKTALGKSFYDASEKVHQGKEQVEVSSHYNPALFGRRGKNRIWILRQAGAKTVLVERNEKDSQPEQGSLIAFLRANRPVLHSLIGDGPAEQTSHRIMVSPQAPFSLPCRVGQKWHLACDNGTLILTTLTKPPWAQAIGRDAFGLWATLRYKNVEQRLRWIPPGQFTMGSPQNETGRYDRETQHEVTLSRGYWLFDTPVTQALWKEVMGTEPSHFKGENLPVEQVSWDDCQKFLQKINAAMPGLSLCLPTEAQWEYACRAGTETATYAGNFQKGEEKKAAILDAIAWYHGNSGSKIHSVAEKAANAFGLYDMLGNVREWCADWYEDYPQEAVSDPIGPGKGAYRVDRGGSWYSNAQYARAAYRFDQRPATSDQRPATWLPEQPPGLSLRPSSRSMSK